MRKLQTGERPHGAALPVDPEAPLQRLAPTSYHRSKVPGDHGTSNIGAMPSETYQYDIVYEAFCNDREFWQNWHVIGCERNSATESVSQDNASIRVVMKLSPSQRLFPTAYTPGFPTLPANSRVGLPKEPVNIPGLPLGFSVALDVHILEDARVLLEHQRSFRKGEIDTKYDWLDRIVAAYDAKYPGESTKVHEKPKYQLIGGGDQKPEAHLRAPVGSLPIDCSTPGMSEDLKPFSDLYGDRRKVMQHVGLGAHQVYSENTLVSVFGGDKKIGLPPRDIGRWAEEERPVSKSASSVVQEIDGKALDAQLDALLARTALSEDF